MSDADLDPRIHELIGHIYDAAINPDLWPNFLKSLSRLYSCNSVFFAQYVETPGVDFHHSAGFDPAWLRAYEEHYADTNVWIPPSLKLPSGGIATGSDLVSPDVLSRSEYFNDWLKPQGLAHGLGGIVANERSLVTHISAIRPAEAGDYTPLEREMFRVITGHLQRAVAIHRELAVSRVQRDAGLEALERLGIATLLVDISARVLFANPAASVLLNECDGLSASSGRLVARSSRRTEQLQQLIHAAASAAAGVGHHSGGTMPLPRRDRRPLTALVTPMKGEAFGLGLPIPTALIFVRDPARRPISQPDVLKVLFGLTTSEARVAIAVTEGESVERIAERHQTSVHTVRLHIKNALAKAGVHRQTELIALILRSAATLS